MFVIELIGHLGKDASVVNNNGNTFVSFNVAANNISTDISGNKIENTTWVSVTTQPNDKLLPYLVKGTSVFIRGLGRLRVYKSNNGPAIDVSCRASELRLLNSKKDDTQNNLNNGPSKTDNNIDMPF